VKEVTKTKSESFQWFEPQWSYRPKVKVELFRILNFKMWLRIVAIVIPLTILLAYGTKRAFPNLEFDWVAALGGSIGIAIAMLALMTAILWFVPPIVSINCKGVFYQQGQSTRQRLRSDIRSITIDFTDPVRPFLHVETSKRPLECGIAPQISLQNLVQFLRGSFPELLVTEKR
jgi:hypothetical protein